MGLFNKKPADTEDSYIARNTTIDYLRKTTDKDYEKIIKITEIYRRADAEVNIVEFGSKKAAREAMRANDSIAEAEGNLELEAEDEQ